MSTGYIPPQDTNETERKRDSFVKITSRELEKGGQYVVTTYIIDWNKVDTECLFGKRKFFFYRKNSTKL